VAVIRRAEPDGLDAVFDGMGEAYLKGGFSLLRHGGIWVGYANPGSNSATLRLLGRVVLYNLLLNGNRQILRHWRSFNRRPFLEDWAACSSSWKKAKLSR
jgi:NADPH:quinone reductase-like Zn-dependent oxidoreductase